MAKAKRSANFIIKMRRLAIQLVLMWNGSTVGAGLDGVDEEAVGVEGRFAVGRRGEGHDGAFADGEGADAVDGDRLGDGEFLHRLGEDALAFLGRENRVMGVVELFDVAAFVVVPNEAFEDDESAAAGIGHLCSE